MRVLFVPFSIYGVWRSEYALFLALYDSDYWDVLKVLSERTLQNMTKLIWAIKRVKSTFPGDKKHFSNFLGFICFYICLNIISSYWNQNTYLKERTQTFEMGMDFHGLERSVILEHRLVMSEMKIQIDGNVHQSQTIIPFLCLNLHLILIISRKNHEGLLFM